MKIPALRSVCHWWSALSQRAKGLVVVTLPLGAMLFSFVSSCLINWEQDKASRMVQRSMSVRFETDKLQGEMSHAGRVADAYVLNGGERRLTRYRAVVNEIPDTLARLSGFLADNAAQRARFQQMKSSVNTQLALLNERVDKIPPTVTADDAARPAADEDRMAALHREIGEVDAEEQRLQTERAYHLERVERWRDLIDGGGIIVGMIGALVAVRLLGQSERAMAETLHHLRKSEELYRALAHNFPNGSIFLFDHDLRYLVADGSDLVEYGFSREMVEGRTLPEVLPPETTARLAPFYRATLRGETLVEEFPLGERTYLMQFLPLRDEAGTIYAGLLINQNITVRKCAEEAFRLARDEAERANRAKSQFLSRMSHELRTPLNAILGFGQVLELSTLPDQQGECVRHMVKAGRHLLVLVDEVLDLACVEAGELRLKLAAVRFDVLAHECISFMTPIMRKRAVTCCVEKSPAFEIPVWADKHRLRQLMLNLLSNAIKYNREGGQVTLACRRMPEGRTRLEVRDTGCGMSAEDLERLFVPFERLGQEHGEVEGTGLGLVVSKELAEAMNGSLGADSVLDEGSTFWIELPGVKAALVAQDEPVRVNGRSLESSESGPATVLYIEDNSSNLGVVSMLVSRLRPHWRFLAAHDGYHGVEMARECHPNCILLDLQLPGMNGDQVLLELRSHASTREIPVLFVSADVMTRSREALLELGAADYLPKPFEVADLLEKLDQHMVPLRAS